jgi:hypothetical protein
MLKKIDVKIIGVLAPIVFILGFIVFASFFADSIGVALIAGGLGGVLLLAVLVYFARLYWEIVKEVSKDFER